MGKPGYTGLRRLGKAYAYSVQGLRYAWKNEEAFRLQAVLTVLLLPCAFWLARSALQVVLLVGVCLFVMLIELLNSAIEAAIDRHGDEHHPLSGAAKDLGSAAVFVSMWFVPMVWIAVIYDRFIA